MTKTTAAPGVSWMTRRTVAVLTLATAASMLLVVPRAKADGESTGVSGTVWANDFSSTEAGADFTAFTLANVAKVIGADKAQKTVTGKGIDIALIDSGVVPVAGLGPTVNGPDLSFDSQNPTMAYLDGYGHGTHMAGIINGNGLFGGGKGIAPDARVVNVKVGSANGAVDVSQVIAAIDWVVQHRNTDGLNIRVISLSFGTDSLQPYEIDPLAYAAEVAWRKGIVVVAAAGNRGQSAASLDDPAYDPYLIAVGAAEPNGSHQTNDDTVAPFSSRGTVARKPDLVAPGRSIVSLRDPNSFIDLQHPEARVSDTQFRGSGTSQATAVTAGAVALLLQQRPALTPPQVKWLLTNTAQPIVTTDPQSVGAGELDIAKAMSTTAPATVQTWTQSTGTGTLEGSRGTAHVVDGTGSVLSGEYDIFGNPWNGQSWSGQSWSGTSWSGGSWLGTSWSGTSWSGQSWSGQSWSGTSWSGQSWSGTSWSGTSWSGQSWSGQSWSGQSWSGQSWSGTSWSGQSWSGTSWSGAT